MPKKFSGINSKAAEAQARRSAQVEAQKAKKEAEAEDEFWRDDDKHANRKLQRKDDKEKKRLQQLEKKKELQQLHEEEMSKLKSAKPSAPSKITRGEIASHLEKDSSKKKKGTRDIDSEDDDPLEENLNHRFADGDEARTVEEAINILSVAEDDVDKHPEKRMKAAFKKFESERLPVLKRENPNLRLTQVKQLLQKEWMKSDDNPLVQAAMKR